jgi:hypothetical protein
MSTAPTQDPTGHRPGGSLFQLRECELSRVAATTARCLPRRHPPRLWALRATICAQVSQLRLIRYDLRRCAQGVGPLFAAPPHPAGLFVQVHLGLRVTRFGADYRARGSLERRILVTAEGQAYVAVGQGAGPPEPAASVDTAHPVDPDLLDQQLSGRLVLGQRRLGGCRLADGLSVGGFCSGVITADDEYVSAAFRWQAVALPEVSTGPARFGVCYARSRRGAAAAGGGHRRVGPRPRQGGFSPPVLLRSRLACSWSVTTVFPTQLREATIQAG